MTIASDQGRDELDHGYAVVGEMLGYFDSHHLATWAPLASIIVRERQTAVDAALQSDGKRIAELEAALEVGKRFLDACYSAWSCGEPHHRVVKMLDLADEFRSLLTKEPSDVR